MTHDSAAAFLFADIAGFTALTEPTETKAAGSEAPYFYFKTSRPKRSPEPEPMTEMSPPCRLPFTLET